jgi:glycosyltransferase involved in cell wall biosynthesis
MFFTVFSHLRWNFVFQRPQHLITRCSAANRVLFWEEPVFDGDRVFLHVYDANPNLKVAVPHLPYGLSEPEISAAQRLLLDDFFSRHAVKERVLWYYTPLALDFSRHLPASAVVYDCMDELSAFRGAPVGLRAAEAELFKRADVVFTGGKSLYESKRAQHPSVHCFPSSIDREFFATARKIRTDVPDQADIPHPRLGFCGVIDERMDLDLLAAAADARPDWHFIMLGPIAKISDSDLPSQPNIHYLGQRDYKLLPAYFAGWDVGLLPFALNESTRFISPTKTPEYLAAGLPAVSTPIRDVVDPYGAAGLVHIAKAASEFVTAMQEAIDSRNSAQRLARVDRHLSDMSWDLTWQRMARLLNSVVKTNRVTADVESIVAGQAPDEGVECSII